MKFIAHVVAALAATTTFLAVAPTVAQAAPSAVPAASAAAAKGTPGCITRAEYRRIKKGATVKQVQKIVGARGRVQSHNTFSDGDTHKTLEFRQCGESWTMSSVSVSVESTEREVYVEDIVCFGYGECEDWGGYETQYVNPLRVTSKYAYWF